jgi:DNA-binding LacI/PurR family transcriptional regulator
MTLGEGLSVISVLLGIVALIVAIVVVLVTGGRKSETLAVLERGNRELREQNAGQEKRLTGLQREQGTLREMITQRAAVDELARNITDLRTDMTSSQKGLIALMQSQTRTLDAIAVRIEQMAVKAMSDTGSKGRGDT